jgi:hypothetical protein
MSEVRTQKSEGIRLSGVAPDCPVQQDDKGSTIDQLRTLTFALTWRAPDSAQWLSGGAPDCPVRPSLAEFSQRLEVVGRL